MTVWKGISNAAVAVLVLLGVGVVAYGYSRPMKEYRNLSGRKQQIEANIAQQQAKLDELKQRQDRLQNDPRFAERLARERFGYCKPGETVFKFEGDVAPESSRL